MKVFNKFVKVIAIRDAPIVDSRQFGNGIQAYKKGDIFEVLSAFKAKDITKGTVDIDQIVVWHPKIGSTMALESKNFELLSEFRNKQIDEIIR
jgi:hypothetical protein